MTIYGLTDGSPECECHACLRESKEVPDMAKIAEWFPRAKMILCGECGNKRCPKASDHRLNCTNSNEPGQAGSVYAALRSLKGRESK